MGSYVTTTSISLMLPGFLKDNTTSSDTEGTNIVNRQINNAEAIVNATIAPYYSISGFTVTPPLLRKLSEDITIYNVIKATGYRANDRNEYLDDYRAAFDLLNEIKEGKIKLTYTDGSSVAVLASNRFLSSADGYTPVFGLDSQTNWERDQDEIDDQDTARS